MTADPVRSIQIASALLERLVELLRPRRGGELLGMLSPEVAADHLELRLGEAQQLMPEVWRHLDEARNAMHARGLRVAGYDEIRSIPDPALLATSEIEVKRKLDVLGLVQGDLKIVTTKTVKWDTRNVIIAALAVDFLKDEVPDVDWAALDKAHADEIAAVGSLRTTRMKSVKMWGLGLVALAALGIGGYVVVASTREKPASAASAQPSAASRVKHASKIAELRQKYAANPCDASTMRALTAYLFADGQQAETREIEERFARECKAE